MAKIRGRRAVKGINRHWLTDREITKILERLEDLRNPQPAIVFGILLSTGQKFSNIRRLKWDGFNSRLLTLRINNKYIPIPKRVSRRLAIMREKASGPNQQIFTIQYKQFWDFMAKISDKNGLKKCGVLVVRNTFAYRHYQIYQSKIRLKHALGLTSIRHVPESVFNAKPRSIFDF